MTEYKLDVCCDMMQEGIDYDQVRIRDGSTAVLPLHNGTCDINYCPWCGKHIRFKREYGWDEE